MSIHARIKALREGMGWSHQRLADEISKLEGLQKKLAWQTVQQWEKGTAPKRTRLPAVAKALKTTVEDLLGEPKTVLAEPSADYSIDDPVTADHIMVFGLLSEEDRAEVHALACAIVLEKHPRLAALMERAGVSRRADDAKVAAWKAKIDSGAHAIPNAGGTELLEATDKQLDEIVSKANEVLNLAQKLHERGVIQDSAPVVDHLVEAADGLRHLFKLS